MHDLHKRMPAYTFIHFKFTQDKQENKTARKIRQNKDLTDRNKTEKVEEIDRRKLQTISKWLYIY